MENKLPEDFKKRWVAALRSGEYKQGIGHLLDSDGAYCCLGVACKIAGIPDNVMSEYSYTSVLTKEYVLPKFFAHTTMVDPAWWLARMNDEGKPFSEIADYIEKEL